MDGTNRKTYWYEAIGSALDLPFLKEVSSFFDVVNLKNEKVSQNCFVFYVVNFKK